MASSSPAPRTVTLRFALVAALALTLAACDAAAPAGPAPLVEDAPAPPASLIPTAVRVPVDGASAGDFVYTLAPLPIGGVFGVRLELASGRTATVRNGAAGQGAAVSLDLDGFAPDSVTVEYLADGVAVAPPLTYAARPGTTRRASSAYPAGMSDRGPDSYHWEERDGQIVLVEDYKGDPDAQARRAGGPGSGFVTASGERVRVTDVAFTVHGVGPDAAQAVVFESPSLFVLSWFDLLD